MNRYRITAAGRVNLIGEHVDYCGGPVMPCALSLNNTVLARANGTNSVRLRWKDGETLQFDLSDPDHVRDHPHGRYIAGCAALWKKAGHRVVGCDLELSCNVPYGSGLSSSAAIEVSAIAAFATVAGESFDPVEVALVAREAERQYAGVNCGIMDQYASACGRKDSVMLLDCGTLSCEYLPFPAAETVLVLADCRKPHNLVESKYNERRAEVDAALELLNQRLPVPSLSALTVEEFNAVSHVLPPLLARRARHVVEECARVKEAAKALKEGSMSAFGALLNRSHASLRDLYEVTGRELDALQEAAIRHPACLGSCMTGAGFGGCTVSLVKKGAEEDFRREAAARYFAATGYTAAFYAVTPSDGITVTEL